MFSSLKPAKTNPEPRPLLEKWFDYTRVESQSKLSLKSKTALVETVLTQL